MCECSKEGILRRIFGVVVIPSYALDGANKFLRVSPVQRFESRSFPAPHRGHQSCIGHARMVLSAGLGRQPPIGVSGGDWKEMVLITPFEGEAALLVALYFDTFSSVKPGVDRMSAGPQSREGRAQRGQEDRIFRAGEL